MVLPFEIFACINRVLEICLTGDFDAHASQGQEMGQKHGFAHPTRFCQEEEDQGWKRLDLEQVRVVKLKRRRYILAELMAQFRPEHRHSEWELGDPAGRESW